MADNVTEQTKEKAGTRRGADVERTVKVTLQEAYSGATRPYTAITAAGQERHAALEIPPGVTTGTTMRYTGYGLSVRAGGAPGDLYLLIEVAPHTGFERRGNDLYHQLTVPWVKLAQGGIVPVKTLDERTISLTLPVGIRDGQLFRLPGEGMPQLHQPDHRGDLYVTVNATLSRGGNITDQQTAREAGKTTKQQTPQQDDSAELVFIAMLLTAFFVAGIGAGLLLYWLILD
jgi:curved DNA-binding protein